MRLHARPIDLPFADPVLAAALCAVSESPPGAMADLRAVAATLRATADMLRGVLRDLRSIAQAGALWCGEAGEAFAARLAEPAGSHLNEVPARYDSYADALMEYAGALEVTRLDLEAARSNADAAVRAHTTVAGRAGASPAEVLAAEHACLAAARRYAERYDAWVSDVNRCVDRLTVIDRSDHLHNPHGWHAAVDSIAEVCGDLSTITAVLGVVALAVCPVVAPALFAASLATSGSALAADADRKVQYGEHVTITDLAFDAAGTLPLARVTRGARSAARAARHAPSEAGRAATAVRAYGRTIGRAYRTDLWREPAAGVRELASPGGLARSLTRPSIRPFRENADEVASLGASCGRSTVDHRQDGVVDAAARSPGRVVWSPVADLAAP